MLIIICPIAIALHGTDYTITSPILPQFLQGVSYASHVLTSHRRYVCLSVCHTLALSENDAS